MTPYSILINCENEKYVNQQISCTFNLLPLGKNNKFLIDFGDSEKKIFIFNKSSSNVIKTYSKPGYYMLNATLIDEIATNSTYISGISYII